MILFRRKSYGIRPYNLTPILVWPLRLSLGFLILNVIVLNIGGYYPSHAVDFNGYPDGEGYNQSYLFYPNLRFASPNLTFKVSPDCSEASKAAIYHALEEIHNNTVLSFSRVFSRAEHANLVYACQYGSRVSWNNPSPLATTRVTKIKVHREWLEIVESSVVMMQEEDCPPKVTIHETFHALGFDHNDNPKSIMYPYLNCEDQNINNYLYDRINEIYRSVV